MAAGEAPPGLVFDFANEAKITWLGDRQARCDRGCGVERPSREITLSFIAPAQVLAERSQFVLHLGRVRRFVTLPSQPCQDAKHRAIPGCPGPLAMEQLRP